MTEVRTRANLLLAEASDASLEEIRGSLRGFGIGGYASDAFCALTRAGSATAGDLVRATGIPDSKIYYALDELVEKGLAEVQDGKPKTYRTVPAPEIDARLSGIVETRRDRDRESITRLVSLIEPLRAATKSPSAEIAYIVKGATNVVARARALIASARRDVVLLASDKDLVRTLSADLAKALGRRVRVKLAVPDVALPKDLAKRAEVREIVCSCIVLVVDGQQVLTVSGFSGDSTYGITSTDETLVRLGLEYWESPRCCVA